MPGYLAVKCGKDLEQEEEDIEYHGICHDPGESPDLFFSRVKLSHLSDYQT